ncbi:MAG: methyl-accepting chemotaxis protein [Pseudomonadota bacterium]
MQAFYNLKIATKLLSAFMAVLALTAVLGIYSVTQLATVNQAARDLNDNWMPSVRTLLEMKAGLARYRTQELQHILSTTDEEMTRYEKTMEPLWAEVQQNRLAYEKLISEQEEKQIYPEFVNMMNLYAAEHTKVAALSRSNKTDDARTLMRGDSTKFYIAMNGMVDKLVAINVAGAGRAGEEAQALYVRARAWDIGMLIGSIVLGLGLALWIARIVSGPLGEAVRVAQTVAAGDLTSQFGEPTRDETGQLLEALRRMNESLAKVVGEVRSGTDSIATASGQIAAGNHDLSARTEQQASSLEEIAASMEEITATVKQSADNARQANQLAQSASEVAVRGGAAVRQVVGTMASISSSSKKIVDIIGVIDGIAFQTNILALNAAVEAARAGEQGRGFAVVASEVRSLAQRSSAAAKEIKGLIDDSVRNVGAGSAQVDEAGRTMDEIVGSVKRVSDIIGEISAASHEQTAGIEQINEAIGQMDQVTQQNAALVEEAAAAASSMDEQASGLVRAVSIFRLNDRGHGPVGYTAAPRLAA